MRPIIRAKNLSKRYRIGERSVGYAGLRDAFARAVHSPLKMLRRRAETNEEFVWALKDINFEVQ